MDNIKLVVRTTGAWAHEEEGFQSVDVFINDRNLIDLVHEVELPFATADGKPETAGSYAGLPKYAVFLPSTQLLGIAINGPYMSPDAFGDKVGVLTCAHCRELACWPLLARIAVDDEVVTWSDFEQPWRETRVRLSPHAPWRHKSLGPFTFDRRRYDAALAGPA